MKTITNHNLSALVSAVLREVNNGGIFKDAREVAGLYYAEVIESAKDLEPSTVEELELSTKSVQEPVQEAPPEPEVKPAKKTRKTKTVEPEADSAEGA